jgi:OFA family oxalate/formate antiporter-like MFS transporter
MFKDLLEKNRWYVVIGALLIQLALGSLYSWGTMTVFVSPVLELVKEVTVYIFGIAIISFAVTMVSAGNIAKRIGPQKTAILGGIILSIGAFLASVFITIKSFPGMIFSYGFLFGAGIGIAYVVPIATANKWFPDKKGFITGISVAGFGAGSFIFNYLIKFFANPAGLKVTDADFVSTMESTTPLMYIVLGIIYMAMIIGGSLFMNNPPKGFTPEGWEPPEVEEGDLKASVEFKRSEIVNLPQTYLLIGAYLLSAMCGLIVIGSFASFATSLDSNENFLYVIGTVDFVLVGSLAALFNGAGRIVWGKVADILDFRKAMIIMFLIQAFLCFIYFATNVNQIFFLLITCLIFFCFGGNLSLFPTATSDLYGKENLSSNYGLIFWGYGIAGFIGAVATNQIVTIFGSYLLLFIVMGIMSIGAAVLAFLIKAPKKETKKVSK